MDDPESETPVYVDARKVSCDGGGGALGHPQVYLNMGTNAVTYCPYCSRQFILAENAQEPAGH